MGPTRVFTKLLIANRGEIAVRVIRACREMGIAAVAVYSEADREALHVRLADEAYPIGPPPARESYLSIERILEAAKRSGAEAIHPGYGFLSENPLLPEACEAAGIVFIGPGAAAMRLMGNKVSARQAMIAAGVPVTPGTGLLPENAAEAQAIAERVIAAGIAGASGSGGGEDPSSRRERPGPRRGTSRRRLSQVGASRKTHASAADGSGEAAPYYPMLLKAAAGGGGKGMRVVSSPAEFASAYAQARSEALSSFGDPSVYAEKLVMRPRHIEVQVLADLAGATIHLGERECSIQRRHQKLVEECPSPIVDAPTRARIGQLAVRAARAAGYAGAGTCEFLRDPDGSFYFMEMNARLQVEHPVTEMVTGLDLVKLQIRIAAGEPLPLRQEDVAMRGWAIECRIFAEDPQRGFMPSPGRIGTLRVPAGPGIRDDGGVYQGYRVPVHYDPMISKLVSWGASREEAIARMRRALDEYRIEGIRTTIPFHRRVVRHPAFLAGDLDTAFIERHRAELIPRDDMSGNLPLELPSESRRRSRVPGKAAMGEAKDIPRAGASTGPAYGGRPTTREIAVLAAAITFYWRAEGGAAGLTRAEDVAGRGGDAAAVGAGGTAARRTGWKTAARLESMRDR